MSTRILLTVDTELIWRPGDDPGGWPELLARSYDPAGAGVPMILRGLAGRALKAVFFVDPMPACRFGLDPVRRMIEPILAAGHEVQLHLHPSWSLTAAKAATGQGFELTGWDEDGQLALIARARDLLVAAGAPDPIAFRAGSYAADDRTLRALRRLGLRYDSSHNGGHAPWPSAIALPPTQIAPVLREGVIEVPVGLVEDRGRLRNLQLCALSRAEMRNAILYAVGAGHPVVTIVTHSFELASRNAARPNRVHVRRFETLLDLLDEQRDAAPTTGFADLAALPLGVEAQPMAVGRTRGMMRQAGQLWSNLYEERR